MGDNKYAKRAGTTDAIALVASELSFFHPFTGQPMRFALSSLPPHWKTFWP
jgi:23S rRNA-/tRNA-specific pseudouridylate synthase